jgi:aspartate/methionine/tyrosine aminotransferase
VRGELDLKVAYCEHLRTIHGGQCEPDNVTITAGCNQAFFITALTLLRPGDCVLLPCPWYFNHKMTLDMLGIGVKPLPTWPEAGYLPDVEAAAASIDQSVRAVVLVTPNNPTGAEYPAALLERFYDLCRQKGIWLILDETYRDFRADVDARPYGLASSGWPEALVSVYSFSKGYAVPGHRLGAITAPTSLSPELLKVQDCVQICAGRAIQSAMTWGLPNLGAWQADRRRDVAHAQLGLSSALGGTGWSIDSSGAYFAYLRHPFGGTSSGQVAEQLARECGILVIAGSSFGPGQLDHVRLSFPGLTPNDSEALANRLAIFAERRRAGR